MRAPWVSFLMGLQLLALYCITAETGRNDTIAPGRNFGTGLFQLSETGIVVVMDVRAYYSSLGLSELTLTGPRLQAIGNKRGRFRIEIWRPAGQAACVARSNTKKGDF